MYKIKYLLQLQYICYIYYMYWYWYIDSTYGRMNARKKITTQLQKSKSYKIIGP